MVKIGDQLELTVDRLSYGGGRGVCRHNNFVVFVPDVAPGEKIKAEVVELKKNFAVAKLLSILTPSQFRRTTPCPVANKCGGCNWQHIEYNEQLRQKSAFIHYHLKKFLTPEITKIEVFPSKDEFNYRNRVQIHAKRNLANEIELGFFARGSNELVSIETCLISDKKLFLGLKNDLNEMYFKNIKQDEALKLELALQDTHRVVRNLDKEKSAFTQVNTEQNLFLQKYIVEQIKKYHASSEDIFDFYCGDGNLTLPIASAFPVSAVTGVEYNKDAIERAKLRRPPNTQFIAQDTLKYLKSRTTPTGSVFVLDPARAGLEDKVCEAIVRHHPRLILYVSCNLSSLARDLEQLCKQSYTLVDVIGIDMFPQTDHIETIATLLPRDI